jgi:translation initiation factor IF-2
LISAKEGKGIKDLMELIVLVSEVNEIKGDADGDLEGFVVETKKDKKGLLATVIVRNGKIRIGDQILIEGIITKVKGIFNFLGKPVKEVLPSEPALIMGFEKLPEIGAKVQKWNKDTPIVMQNLNVVSQKNLQKEAKLNLVLKARTAGSLEAILENISPEINILDFSVGEVNESDVFTAKSQEGARIFAFELKVPSTVAKLAETEGVKIETFEIIYRLFERVEDLIKKPEEEYLGKAEVVAIFPYENKKVAGCKVINGKISKNDKLLILRGDKEFGKTKASSMKKEKKEINQASQGEEFGVIFEPQLAFTIGDVVVSIPK